MNFERQEGIRCVFNEPIDANFVMISEDGQVSAKRTSHSCQILDL